MIKSFADKETEKVYNQIFSKKLPHNIQRVALRKLIMIDNAGCLEDLKVPPANRLEASPIFPCDIRRAIDCHGDIAEIENSISGIVVFAQLEILLGVC